MLSLLIILLGIVVNGDTAITRDGDRGDSMVPEGNVCKICYKNGSNQPECQNAADVCFGNDFCRRAVERLCPPIQYCREKPASERYPMVVDRTKQDNTIAAVCQCRICKNTGSIGDKNDQLDRERPIRERECCLIRRELRNDNITITVPKGDCEPRGGMIIPLMKCRQRPKNEDCSNNPDPICDIDGNIYGNPCRARKAGVARADLRRCPDDCGCLIGYRSPICVKITDDMGNTTFKTFENKCRFNCARKRLGNVPAIANAKIVSNSVCIRDRKCRVSDSERGPPVCDERNLVTYGSYAECVCDGACKTQESFSLGRCPRDTETKCKCTRLVSDSKPLCRRKANNVFETIRDRCLAICEDIIDINTTRIDRPIISRDGSMITDGICTEDEDDCTVTRSVRKSCDESEQRPKKARVRLRFRIAACYPDVGNREYLFDSIREAIARILYDQCGLMRDDDDDILITRFTAIKPAIIDVVRSKVCNADQDFDIELSIFRRLFAKIKEATQCLNSFDATTMRERLKALIREAADKRNPDTQDCQCPMNRQNSLCNRDSNTCSDCTCQPSGDIATSYGDIEINAAFSIDELDIGDVNVTTSTTPAGGPVTEPSSASNIVLYYTVFLTFFYILFC